MGWIGCLCCEKIRRDFVARTFELVRPVLHLVRQPNCLECTQIVQNAPKRQFRVQWGGLGAFVVTEFRKVTNSPECTQIVRNAPKHQFTVQWGGSDVFAAKNSEATSWHELLHYFGPFCTEFRMATKRSRMHTNSMKCTKMSV